MAILNMYFVRKKLFINWVAFMTFPFFIILIQTISQHYGSSEGCLKDAIAGLVWFFSYFIPIVSIFMGVFKSVADEASEKLEVSPPLFRLARIGTIIIPLMMVLLIILQAVAQLDIKFWFAITGLILLPMQTWLGTILIKIFVRSF